MILADGFLIFAYHLFYELKPNSLFSIHLETFRFLNRTERLILKVCKYNHKRFYHSNTSHIVTVSFLGVEISDYFLNIII